MRTATSLTLLTIGAILAFAITGHPSFLNVQVVGVVIMATGLIGLLMPRRGREWLHRRTVTRRDASAAAPRRTATRHRRQRQPGYYQLSAGTADASNGSSVVEAVTLEDMLLAERQSAEPAGPADLAEVSDSEVSDSEVSDSEVSDSEVSDSEVSDSEVFDEYLED